MKLNFIELNENTEQYAGSLTQIELENLIKHCNQKYHNEIPIISDYIYDILIEILEKKNSNSSILSNVGFKSNNDKHKLPFFMGSMNKTKTYEGIIKWINKYNDNNSFVISEKLDGISALLTTENNEIKIFTRGNGNYGRDISYIKNYINIPKLDNIDMVVRGELIIKKKIFDENRGNYISSRNMVGGLLMNKTEDKQLKLLDFVVFEVIKPCIPPNNQFEYATSKNFNCVKNIEITYNKLLENTSETSFFVLNLLNEFRKKSLYEIDGIIITHNKNYEREIGNPKHSIAFKNNQYGKLTIVKEIIWSVSKYGILIPRIHFEKTNLGSIIEYCTGFNGKFIFNNSLGPGSKIRIVLSGDVIPFITEVVSSSYPQMPNTNYKWDSNKVHCVMIDNDDNYEKKRILYFIKTIKIDNLSTGLINKLYENGYNSLSKILLITKSDLLKLDGIKETLASKIINNITKIISEPIELSTLMVGSLLFDSGFGNKKINKILEKYPHILDIDITIDEIIVIEGFQYKTAKQFIDNLGKFKLFLNSINFIKYSVSQNKNKNKNKNKNNSQNSESINIFTNKKIVLTGFRDDNLINYIENSNGIIQSSINSKTDLLIVKDRDYISSKVDSAILLGKTILYKNELKL